MNDITSFSFDSNSVRVTARDGEPWIVTADAARPTVCKTDSCPAAVVPDDLFATEIIARVLNFSGSDKVAALCTVLAAHSPKAVLAVLEQRENSPN